MAFSAGSSRVSPEKYDVFLSLRGEDTRKNFTGHLYAALTDKRIKTYIDYDLVKGGDIWGELCRAIENSHISLVVFSEDYASSKWCLEELVRIMECRRDLGLVVIPVFYKTEPSHIRYQEKSYQKAFAKHERNESKHKVRRWRDALTEAANLSGWNSESSGNRDDNQLIRNIVKDVSQRLQLKYDNTIKGLVGIEKTLNDIELFTQKYSKVSRHFTNRTTESSVTIKLPEDAFVGGFLFSVVLSSPLGMKEHGASIRCQCYSADGTEIGCSTGWYYEEVTNLHSDTVFVWYDPFFCDSILKNKIRQVSFRFLNSMNEGNGSVVMKECGVRLIRRSEFHAFLGEMELEFEKKVDLGVKLGLALDLQMDFNPRVHQMLFALEYGWELEPAMKSELELRRKSLVAIIEKEVQKVNEFIFPARRAGMWKKCTQGLKDILAP